MSAFIYLSTELVSVSVLNYALQVPLKCIKMAIFHQLQQILFCIIILAAICNARKVFKSGKRLVRASSDDRVPDSYFIHIKKTVSIDEIHTLVQHLQHRSSKEENFRVSISGIITMAGYGLSTTLSPEALKYVSEYL